jgi:hypothetical protein
MKKSAKPKETVGSRPSETRSLSERYAELLELREGELNDAFSRVFTLEVDGSANHGIRGEPHQRVPRDSARKRGFGMI